MSQARFGATWALVRSDFKDLRRNLTLLPALFIPPLLALLMRKAQPVPVSPVETLPLWLVYAQVLVGMNIISLGLSEEKEKKTLEALLVTPVSLGEVIGAKLVFAMVVTVAVQALTVAVVGTLPGGVAELAVVALIGTAFFALLGLGIGVMAPNQKAAGAISTPFMLAFLILPMVGQASKSLARVVNYFPSYNLGELLRSVMRGSGGAGLWSHAGRDLVSSVVWLVAAAAAAWWVLRRQATR